MKSVHSAPALRSLALVTLATFAFAFPRHADSALDNPTAQALEGVWKITRHVRTGPNAGTDDNPQPGIAIFYRGYCSLVRDNSPEPRKPSPPPADPAKLTDAEKIARYEEWAPFGATASTYELKGDTLITHNIVAKQAHGMTITEEATIKFEGPDTFVASAKAQPGAPSAGQTTYTRLR